MCSENEGTLKELLLLEFNKMRSKNKEILESNKKRVPLCLQVLTEHFHYRLHVSFIRNWFIRNE